MEEHAVAATEGHIGNRVVLDMVAMGGDGGGGRQQRKRLQQRRGSQ
jgi:hypothetical protein